MKPKHQSPVSKLLKNTPTGPRPVKPAEPEPISVGVPLTQLIQRELVLTTDVVMLKQPRSLAAERFRRLKTLLTHRGEERTQVLLVTSGSPGEGKSTVSLNLALTFAADTDEKTLLLDADLRRPSIERRLQPRPQLGLSELLSGRTELEHVIIRLKNTPLEVLPAGDHADDPLELLVSDRARSLVETLRQRYERIIVDTPPVLPFTEADAFGAMGDGVIVVVRSGVTPVAMYKQVIGTITSAPILGTVLNDAYRSLADWSSYTQYDYRKYYKYGREER
jgi:capsular exopolysaccharide synthesis family protein